MKSATFDCAILSFYKLFFCRSYWVLVAVLFSGPAFAGTGAFNCDSPRALIDSISKIENDNATWVKLQTSQFLNQSTLSDTIEGRRLQLFSAELLPKTASFASMYRQCWIFLNDFEESLKKKALVKNTVFSKISQISFRTPSEDFERWYNCVEVSMKPLPSEAAELKACWEKISSTTHHP